MKLLMFDFECPVHGKFEDLAKSSVKAIPCPQCKAPANRIISPVKIDKLGMALQDGASPTSIDYFERIHRQRKKIEDAKFAAHGDYGTHAGGDGGSPVTPEAAAKLGS
jgi:hypothetical protein